MSFYYGGAAKTAPPLFFVPSTELLQVHFYGIGQAVI